MANATIYTKTVTAGAGKTLILEPGEELLRKTNFPANWLRVRIALIGSLTNLTQSNGTPNVETLNANGLGPKFGLNVGLSNGVGYIGDVGNRFVGVGTRRDTAAVGVYVHQVASNWQMAYTTAQTGQYVRMLTGNGASVLTAGTSILANAHTMNDPTASNTCMFGVCYELITSGVDGTLAVNAYAVGSTPIGDNSNARINLILQGNGASLNSFGSQTGGWWTGSGSTPVDCTFLSIRCPLTQNRLRIHNMMLQQLA